MTLSWLSAHWAEIVGFVTGVICVFLAARRNIWTFPVGIANNVVFAGLFISSGVYANAGLQIIYLALGIHGWMNWHGSRSQPKFVLRTPRAAILPLIVAGLVATFLLAWLLQNYTDSKVPYADAATTGVSLVAQYMLNRRWLECWFVWIAVDVAYIILYLSIGLPVTAALYLVFIALCVSGLRQWSAERREVGAR